MSHPNIRTRRRGNSGFTLIELLVVIAIISILAAILFPVFAKAREKARQSTCQSNLKQIALGVLQYVQDNDERFPAGAPGALQTGFGFAMNSFVGPNPPGGGPGWAGATYAYVKSTGVFKCPDDPETQVAGVNGNVRYPVSYGLNEFVPHIKLAAMSAPASTVLLSEMTGVQAYINIPDEGASEGLNPTQMSATTSGWQPNGCGAGCGGLDSPGADAWSGVIVTNGVVTGKQASTATDATVGQWARHDPSPASAGGSEYAMADGHVKFLRWPYVSTGITPGYTNQLGTAQWSGMVATYNPYGS